MLINSFSLHAVVIIIIIINLLILPFHFCINFELFFSPKSNLYNPMAQLGPAGYIIIWVVGFLAGEYHNWEIWRSAETSESEPRRHREHFCPKISSNLSDGYTRNPTPSHGDGRKDRNEVKKFCKMWIVLIY